MGIITVLLLRFPTLTELVIWTRILEEVLKDNCYEEVKKSFYMSSPKSKDLQKIEAWREQAKDVLA